MGIVTKQGDKGMTSILPRGKVSKDDLRIEACGTLDELCSFLGWSKSIIKARQTKGIIEMVQKDLFILGAEICSTTPLSSRKNTINSSHIKRLEAVIRREEYAKQPKGCCFCLPGKNSAAASLDIARTVVRRAERKIVALSRKGLLRNSLILVYLNRLSDLLYVLARAAENA